jgi:hypothetical protein
MRSLTVASVAVLTFTTLVGCAAGGGSDPSDPVGGAQTPGEPAPSGASVPGESGGGSGTGSAGGGKPSTNACIPAPSCNDNTAPALDPKRPFAHALSNLIAEGAPNHRGRDMIFAQGEPQWIIGTMAYSIVDKGLEDEAVDIYVERDCESNNWEKLGSVQTTSGGDKDIEGVPDTGARVYFEVPTQRALGIGRHRVRLVVNADQTSTDLLIDVLPKGAQVFVSDVDGTLTSSENAEWSALLTGDPPGEQPKADEALARLASQGIRAVYLTARPEWLTGATKTFLGKYGFPTGIVHTTPSETGATGALAASWKTEELKRLEAHGVKIVWAFGNQPTDAQAYADANIDPPDHRVLLGVNDPNGGRRIESYAEILPVLANQAPVCSK